MWTTNTNKLTYPSIPPKPLQHCRNNYREDSADGADDPEGGSAFSAGQAADIDAEKAGKEAQRQEDCRHQ